MTAAAMQTALELTAEQQARSEDATVTTLDALLVELLNELKQAQLAYFLPGESDEEDRRLTATFQLEADLRDLTLVRALWIVDGTSPIAALAAAAADERPWVVDRLRALVMRVGPLLGLTREEVEATWKATPPQPGERS